MKRAIRLLLLAAAGAGGYAWLRRVTVLRRPEVTEDEAAPTERRETPDPVALSSQISEKFAIDTAKLLSRFKEGAYLPLSEYLTAIRVKRGERDEGLLFVRRNDVDALAALAGTTQEEFLNNFRNLGIVVSLN